MADSNTEPEGTAPASWRGSGDVLVVDDEDMVRLVGTRMLERLGFQVLGAAGGAEAIELFREHHARLRCVLLDMTMTGMDGQTALQALREINPAVPVIIASGYSELAILDKLGDDKADGIIQKPFNIERLRQILWKILSD